MNLSLKKVVLGLSGAALLTASTLSFAERDRMGHFLERMQEKLGLTENQTEQVKVIMQEQRVKKDALRNETDAKLKSVLNDEQVKELEEMRAKHQGWREGKKHKGKGHCHGKGGDNNAAKAQLADEQMEP